MASRFLRVGSPKPRPRTNKGRAGSMGDSLVPLDYYEAADSDAPALVNDLAPEASTEGKKIKVGVCLSGTCSDLGWF